MLRSLARLAPLLALALAACDSSPELCSTEAIAECRINQHACEPLATGPSCTPCDLGEHANESGLCAPIVGTALRHDFPEQSTEPGQELAGNCRSWTLGNDEELWVNAVELEQDEASHHSNWTFVPEDSFEGPDGIWKCDDRGYDQLQGALAGGVIYAQSTQASHEVQKFPDGAAVRIPPRSKIISDVHVLNTTEDSITGHAAMTLYTLPESDVTVRLAPFHLTVETLAIPARSKSRWEGTCDVAESFADAVGEPLSMKLYYALPHTHALGRRVFMEIVGGPRDGEMLLDVLGYNGEARGLAYPTPVDLSSIEALRFGCEFDNPRPDVVGWGIGDQEMCEMLGFIEAPVAFESRISAPAEGEADGPTRTFEGACETFMFDWTDH